MSSSAPIDTDSLVSKILAGLKGASSSARDEDGDMDDYSGRKVPVDRLRREIDKRKGLEASLGELTAQLEQLQRGYQAQVEALKGEAAESVKTLQMRHQEDLGLVDMGLTDNLGRQVVRSAYEALPKAQRPPTAQEWWKGVREAHAAHLADPKKVEAPNVPRALTPYLPEPPAQQTQQRTSPTAPGPAPSPGSMPQATDLQGWFQQLAAQEAGQG